MKKIIYIFTLLFSIHYYTALFSAEESMNEIRAFENELIETLHEYDTLEEKVDYLNDLINYYGRFADVPETQKFATYKKISIDLKKKLLGKKTINY